MFGYSCSKLAISAFSPAASLGSATRVTVAGAMTVVGVLALGFAVAAAVPAEKTASATTAATESRLVLLITPPPCVRLTMPPRMERQGKTTARTDEESVKSF